MDSYTDTTKNSLLLVSYKHKKDTPRKVSMCSLKGEDGEINIQAKGIQNTVPSNENIPMKIII